MIGTSPATGVLASAVAAVVFSFHAAAEPSGKPAECRQDPARRDGIALELRLRWRPIGSIRLDASGRLQFPRVREVPGVYRFELRRKETLAVYVGETVSLAQRFYQYRNPGRRQRTSRRICAAIRRTLTFGGDVRVSIGDDAWLCARAGCTRADFRCPHHRKLFEQLAIVSISVTARALNGAPAEISGKDFRQKFGFCS